MQCCICKFAAGTAIGQNHVPNLHFIDQGPEDGLELDNLLLERRSSNKSNNSRRSSNLSRHESLPTVQVIPPSITGGKIKDEKCRNVYYLNENILIKIQ